MTKPYADTAADNAAAFAAYYGISRRRTHVVGLTRRFVSPPLPPKPPGPYADVRNLLVEKIRHGDKPFRLKRAAEIWIGAIDANGTPEAMEEARVRFLHAAEGAPLPSLLPAVEIARLLEITA